MSQYRRLKDTEGAEAGGHRDPAEIEEDMREREAALGPQAAGVLGKGVHVGTPAGGTTEGRAQGAEHWGAARDADEEE